MTSAQPGVSARTADTSMPCTVVSLDVVPALMRSTCLVRLGGDDGTLPIGAHVSHRRGKILGANGTYQRAMLLRRRAAGLDLPEMRELDALQPLGEPRHELRENGIARALDDDAVKGGVGAQGFRRAAPGD